MSKMEMTSKVSLKLTSRITLRAHRALDFGYSPQGPHLHTHTYTHTHTHTQRERERERERERVLEGLSDQTDFQKIALMDDNILTILLPVKENALIKFIKGLLTLTACLKKYENN